MPQQNSQPGKHLDGVFYESVPAQPLAMPHLEGRGVPSKLWRNLALVGLLLAIQLLVMGWLLQSAGRLG